jgi:hypothetical protein
VNPRTLAAACAVGACMWLLLLAVVWALFH